MDMEMEMDMDMDMDMDMTIWIFVKMHQSTLFRYTVSSIQKWKQNNDAGRSHSGTGKMGRCPPFFGLMPDWNDDCRNADADVFLAFSMAMPSYGHKLR